MKKFFLSALLCLCVLSMNAQRIAVLDFNASTGIPQSEIEGIFATFNTYFSPKGYTLVERALIDNVIDKYGFRRGYLTQDQMMQIAESLNVPYVVVGDVDYSFKQYNVDVRVVNIETTAIIKQARITWNEGESYRPMMKSLAESLAGNVAANSQETKSEVSSPAQIYYEVVAPSNLNVRSAANSNATIIGFLNNGDIVPVYDIVGSWGKIPYDSKIGYVSMSYLKQTLNAQKKSSSSANQTTSAATSSSTSSSSSSNSSYQDASSYNSSSKSSTNTQQTVSSTPTNDFSFGMFLDVTGDVGKLKMLDETAGGIGGDFTAGFYTPEQYNFLGASIGIQSIFCNLDKNNKFTFLVMPIFVNDKLYFTNNEYRPYLDLSIGGYVNLMSKYNDEKFKGEGGGFFFRSGLGVDMRGVNITVGYELLYGKDKDNAMHMVFFKIGIGGVYNTGK